MPPKGTPSPGSGRLRKDTNTRQIQQTLTEAAVYAVKLVRDVVREKDEHGNKVKPLSGSKLKACELAISHAIGLPRQKIDIKHTGDLMTLTDLAKLAKEHELGQFKVLEDTKELAPVEGKNEQN